MELKIKRLHPDAVMPEYATQGAACFDLRTLNGGEVTARGGTMNCRTGLAFEVPPSHVLLVYSRSGHGFKNGLRLVNSVGVIDSDYRGELAVKICNDSPLGFGFMPGDRVAQAMLVPIPSVTLVEVQHLSETDRGENGFGSTGNV